MSGMFVLLLGLSLLVSVGTWYAVANGDVRLEYLCRPVALFFLIAATLEMDPANSNAWAFFVVALGFSMVGDIVLMAMPESFLPRVGCFLAADMAYVGGLLYLGIDGVGLLAGVLLAGLLFAIVGVLILRAVATRHPDLVGPIKAYAGAVSLLVVTACGVGRPLVVLGAGLFYASDTLTGWNRFVRDDPSYPLAISVMSTLGQLGLVLALL
jgi:uncharacterized membrane protein YhhN